MSHWMGWHFLWIDYNNLSGYIFILRDFEVKKIFVVGNLKK